MADDRVDVVFGARVGELISGVAQSKEAIEGLRAPIDSLVGGFRGIAEAIGAAFVVDKIRDFAVEMGKLGEETLNAAAALGTTPEKFEKFAGMLQIAGGSAEGANRTLERLASTLASAVTEPTGRAAETLSRFGLDDQAMFHDSLVRTCRFIPATRAADGRI